MSKKPSLIIGAIGLAIIVAAGLFFLQNQQNKFVNFKDPKLTNEELSRVEGKIRELEAAIESRKGDEKSEDQNKVNDLFKYKMEVASYYRLRGRLLDAKQAVLEASRILPDNPSSYYELYVIERERGDFKSAKDALAKSLQINPSNVQAWRSYVELAEQNLGYTTEQLKSLYEEALSKAVQAADIHVLYALYLEKNNDLAGAVAQLKLAIQKNPGGKAQYEAEIQRIQSKLQ